VPHLGLERTFWKRTKKLGFGPVQVEPRAPVLAFEHDNLAVMIRGNIRPGLRCQHGEAGGAVDGIRPDDAGDTEPICTGERETPFVLRFCLRSAGAVNSKK
jgi:hypothetical protein